MWGIGMRYVIDVTRDYLTDFSHQPVELEQLERFFLSATSFATAFVLGHFI
jgi:hypothetical protein